MNNGITKSTALQLLLTPIEKLFFILLFWLIQHEKKRKFTIKEKYKNVKIQVKRSFFQNKAAINCWKSRINNNNNFLYSESA